MRKTCFIVAFAAPFLFPFAKVDAWNEAGLKTIASIAYLQLSPEDRQKVVAILAHHPRYEEDFKAKLPPEVDDQNEWLIQQAAVWPNLVSRLPEYDRPKWHYYSKPIFLTTKDQTALEPGLSLSLNLDPPEKPTPEMNAVQMIRFARHSLKSIATSPEDQALYLSWLIHGVAEIHQPLNTSVLFSQELFPKGDRGRRTIITDKHGSLRSFWAGLLGVSTEYRKVHDRAVALMKGDRFEESKSMAPLTLDEQIWLDEGYQCAADICYLPEIRNQLQLDSSTRKLADISLSEDYYVQLAHQDSEMYAIDAGCRLAAILKQIADD